jgi:hypothetical protein
MEKEEFVKIITELVKIKKAEDNLNKAFKEFEPDFNHICFGRYETLVVKTLEIAMDDSSKWISYWLYDLDCGEKGKKAPFSGKEVKMKTPADLYDCIKIIR